MQLGKPDKDTLKLPRLRSELSLQRGAVTREGNRGWMIYDPVQHRYFQIDETSFELLSLWSEYEDADDLIAAAAGRFGSRVDKREIEEFVNFLQLDLLRGDGGQSIRPFITLVVHGLHGFQSIVQVARA